MVASDRRRITGCKAVRKKREPLRYGAAKPSRTRLCFDWPRSCVMAGLGLKLQPTRTCGPKIPQWSCVAPETWGLLMLRLLIGLARLDLQILRWATSPGVAMQITQFWTVSIMLPPASSGTHRPTATEVLLFADDRPTASRAHRPSFAQGAKQSHSSAPFDVISWVGTSMHLGASRQSSNRGEHVSGRQLIHAHKQREVRLRSRVTSLNGERV